MIHAGFRSLLNPYGKVWARNILTIFDNLLGILGFASNNLVPHFETIHARKLLKNASETQTRRVVAQTHFGG